MENGLDFISDKRANERSRCIQLEEDYTDQDNVE